MLASRFSSRQKYAIFDIFLDGCRGYPDVVASPATYWIGDHFTGGIEKADSKG